MKKLLFLLFLLLNVTTYAQKNIYTSESFDELSKDHKTLAIMPFYATLHLEDSKNISKENLKKLAEKEGYAVQNAIETYFLKQKQKKKFSVSFQNTGITNSMLAKKGITIDNIDIYTTKQLSEILGVDGIISGNLTLKALISEGVSTDFDIFDYLLGDSGYGRIAIKISDGKTSKLLWKYEKEINKKSGKNTYEIITDMMKKAARKFPYEKDKKKK
ncbi:hypothetical protein SAMN05216480_12228 [Pustulibacterium marinum]|uniref:Uncharacterized protein n=1 Tax=Pustulibacterium marinum TaxID=1224947 RepID=A0A1I7IUU1_9FLAO|nr:hypothetical protein [Pustulibacterium marinum]SFU76690.1 hypothetical protein SAMN05216480_12228 [Pustulibacterium marinum]